jgi:hypothetical protein
LSTKVCPNCGTEVPSVANLCKHCFHDFNMVVAKKQSPWFTLLVLAASTAIVAAIAFSSMHKQGRTKISVNKETEQIVFVTKYADHTESDTVAFKDVSAIEYVMNARPRPFEIAILTTRGERFVYQQADEPIDVDARQLGEFLGKPVVDKDLYDVPAVGKKKE